jgi:hypothetical protein
MAYSRNGLNFKTAPSGMLIPSTADDSANDRVDVTIEHKTNGALGAAGPIGDASHVPIVTIDAYGHVTGLASVLGAGGNQMLLGNGSPGSGTGNLGDSYIDLTSGDVWQKQNVAAAAAFRSMTTDSGLGYSRTIAKPAGVAVGDQLVLVIVAEPSGAPNEHTQPVAGWTLQAQGGSGNTWEVYTRVADGTEGASLTLTHSDNSWWSIGYLAYIGGAFDVIASTSWGTGTTATGPSVTTTQPNGRVVEAVIAFLASNVITPPSGFTERLQVGASSDQRLSVSDKAQASAGATGTPISTVSTSDHGYAITLALKPTGGPTPTWVLQGNLAVATDPIFDAKGDLVAGTGADTAAKVTVGANGQVLTADSTQATGVRWAASAVGLPADTVVVAATRIVANFLAAGDAQPAWRVLGSGRQDWGPGGATAPDTTLYRSGAGVLTTDGRIVAKDANVTFVANPSVSGGYVFGSYIGADSSPRYAVTPNGAIYWGAGGATAPDTDLFRQVTPGVGTGLKTETNLIVGSLTATGSGGVGAGLNLGPGGGLQSIRAANGPASTTYITGDTQPRLQIDTDGTHRWGIGGTTAADTLLYRNGAARLKTDGTLDVGTNLTVDAGNTGARIYLGSDVSLYRAAADRLQTDDHFAATLGVATKVKAGTPADTDWAAAPPDGTLVADSTAGKLWVRVGGVWKGVTVT